MVNTPAARRWRTTLSSEEFYLRDLSPSTTLRAFSEGPSVFDTTRDEYKIYACIESLTAADRELGARVAKAAERLESWSEEIQQWGWPGTFEPPSEEYVQGRRRSIALHIQEHGGDPRAVDLAPLEYYGSLIATEIKEHEARLDEISEELETLEFDELKENILRIHGPRAKPFSSGSSPSQTQSNYTPLDDYSFLITQTLISSLPHHFILKERLNTWSARITVLREVPGYLAELESAKKAMHLAWEAIEPPIDDSDKSFDQWKVAVDTIVGVLQNKVRDLGQRLDRMLDTLEGHRDCLPDDWIDVFEDVEADLRKWSSISRRRMIEFDVLRKRVASQTNGDLHSITEEMESHSLVDSPCITVSKPESEEEPRPRSVTAFKGGMPVVPDEQMPVITSSIQTDGAPDPSLLDDESDFEEGDTVVHNQIPDLEGSYTSSFGSLDERVRDFSSPIVAANGSQDILESRPQTPTRPASAASISSLQSYISSPSVVEDSPTLRKAPRNSRTPRPELNALMGKRRGPLRVIEDAELDSAVPWPPTQFSGRMNPPPPQDLDSKISDILNSIPAHIRLMSGEEATSGARKSSRPGLGKQTSKSYLRSTRSTSGIKSPELTLSPARPDSSAPGAQGGRRTTRGLGFDNDIKLYHLNQPGREKPIKLFIRRVGEQGERVMVRVGGGWADLGEYLRQYAEHHGRRAISDGKFEILGLEGKKEMEGVDRPESAAGKRTRRVSGATNGRTSTTPQRSGRKSAFADETPPPVPGSTNTPMVSPMVDPGSPAPSTDSTHRSWMGEEVGLAGPRVKPLNLDDQKMEWIEGMMKQARSVSNSNLTSTWTPKMDGLPTGGREGASSRPGSRNEARRGPSSRPQSRNGPGPARKQPSFGDLGKVGGTKRVFLRPSFPEK